MAVTPSGSSDGGFSHCRPHSCAGHPTSIKVAQWLRMTCCSCWPISGAQSSERILTAMVVRLLQHPYSAQTLSLCLFFLLCLYLSLSRRLSPPRFCHLHIPGVMYRCGRAGCAHITGTVWQRLRGCTERARAWHCGCAWRYPRHGRRPQRPAQPITRGSDSRENFQHFAMVDTMRT